MNVNTQFAGVAEMAQNLKAKVKGPAAQQRDTSPTIKFEGTEHGDTVHFSGSCCR